MQSVMWLATYTVRFAFDFRRVPKQFSFTVTLHCKSMEYDGDVSLLFRTPLRPRSEPVGPIYSAEYLKTHTPRVRIRLVHKRRYKWKTTKLLSVKSKVQKQRLNWNEVNNYLDSQKIEFESLNVSQIFSRIMLCDYYSKWLEIIFQY